MKQEAVAESRAAQGQAVLGHGAGVLIQARVGTKRGCSDEPTPSPCKRTCDSNEVRKPIWEARKPTNEQKYEDPNVEW